MTTAHDGTLFILFALAAAYAWVLTLMFLYERFFPAEAEPAPSSGWALTTNSPTGTRRPRSP